MLSVGQTNLAWLISDNFNLYVFDLGRTDVHFKQMSFALLFGMLKLLCKIENKVTYGIRKIMQVAFGNQPEASITDIQIIYDSPHFLLVNKHQDVLINHEDKTIPVTVEKQLIRLYPDLVNPKLPMSFYFCHRLDYSTSGIICIAKHKISCSAATKAFSNRETKKYYLAIVRGHISKDHLVINERIGADTREQFKLNKMAISSWPFCSNVTRDAETYIAVLERGICCKYPATKILMRPITGRRHQLRLHCSHIGHTIIGDYTYSNRNDILPYRMYLHAYRLILPTKVEKLDVTTNDPFTPQDERNDWIPYENIMSISSAMEYLNKIEKKIN